MNVHELLRLSVVRWALAVAWSIWITVLLIQPEANPVIDLGLPKGPQTLAREVVFATLHVVAFGVTCALWFHAWSARARPRKSLILACMIAIFMGAATEALQTLAPDRYASWLDFIANICGTLLAAHIIRQRRFAPPPSKSEPT